MPTIDSSMATTAAKRMRAVQRSSERKYGLAIRHTVASVEKRPFTGGLLSGREAFGVALAARQSLKARQSDPICTYSPIKRVYRGRPNGPLSRLNCRRRQNRACGFLQFHRD